MNKKRLAWALVLLISASALFLLVQQLDLTQTQSEEHLIPTSLLIRMLTKAPKDLAAQYALNLNPSLTLNLLLNLAQEFKLVHVLVEGECVFAFTSGVSNGIGGQGEDHHRLDVILVDAPEHFRNIGPEGTCCILLPAKFRRGSETHR